MPRPQCCRRITQNPPCTLFKPAGIPAWDLEEVTMTLDELEAIRLVDYEGFYQEHAAEQMHISRQTLGRIIEAGRKKVAEALLKGKGLRIAGGEVQMNTTRTFTCPRCQQLFSFSTKNPPPTACPQCESIPCSPPSNDIAPKPISQFGQRRNRCRHRQKS